MARKLSIKGDPLAGVGGSSSVMDGILTRNRERGGREAPVTTEPSTEQTPPPEVEADPVTELPSEQASYQVTKLPILVTNLDEGVVEAVVARSMVRGQGQVQTGVRVTEDLYSRLEEVQHKLRRRGVTRQGILIVGLERILDQLEEELKDT